MVSRYLYDTTLPPRPVVLSGLSRTDRRLSAPIRRAPPAAIGDAFVRVPVLKPPLVVNRRTYRAALTDRMNRRRIFVSRRRPRANDEKKRVTVRRVHYRANSLPLIADQTRPDLAVLSARPLFVSKLVYELEIVYINIIYARARNVWYLDVTSFEMTKRK